MKWRVVLDQTELPGVPYSLVALIVEGDELVTQEEAFKAAERAIPVLALGGIAYAAPDTTR